MQEHNDNAGRSVSKQIRDFPTGLELDNTISKQKGVAQRLLPSHTSLRGFHRLINQDLKTLWKTNQDPATQDVLHGSIQFVLTPKSRMKQEHISLRRYAAPPIKKRYEPMCPAAFKSASG